MICPTCKTANDSENVFCVNCGGAIGGGTHLRTTATADPDLVAVQFPDGAASAVAPLKGVRLLVRRADVAVWRRSIRNQGDPNVFAGTTIIFPNSVAEGIARGLDVRLELSRRSGVSGFATYTLGKIDQYGPINGGLFLEDEVIPVNRRGGVRVDVERIEVQHAEDHVAAVGAALGVGDELLVVGVEETQPRVGLQRDVLARSARGSDMRNSDSDATYERNTQPHGVSVVLFRTSDWCSEKFQI